MKYEVGDLIKAKEDFNFGGLEISKGQIFKIIKKDLLRRYTDISDICTHKIYTISLYELLELDFHSILVKTNSKKQGKKTDKEDSKNKNENKKENNIKEYVNIDNDKLTNLLKSSDIKIMSSKDKQKFIIEIIFPTGVSIKDSIKQEELDEIINNNGKIRSYCIAHFRKLMRNFINDYVVSDCINEEDVKENVKEDKSKNKPEEKKKISKWTEWIPFYIELNKIGYYKQNGKRVVFKTPDGKYKGKASCNKGDIFDLNKGIKIASYRCQIKHLRNEINNVNKERNKMLERYVELHKQLKEQLEELTK